jgi:ribonuclease E
VPVEQPTAVPAAPAAPAPVAAEPESTLAHAIESAPAQAPIAETPPVVSTEPIVSAASAPVEAASAATEVGQQPVDVAAAAKTSARANGLAAADLRPMLESAGLVWVGTDADKLRAAQEVAAQAPAPVRVPRERKPLPPADPTPMQQVETHRDA